MDAAQSAPMQIHGSCAARGDAGVLLLGPPGSGKSDLLLRLLDHGFTLVADDRVEVEAGRASPPEALAGLLEVRGLGILRLSYAAPVRLVLVVRMAAMARLPGPAMDPDHHLPSIAVDPAMASAAARVAMALGCALGGVAQDCGAFAA